MKKLFFFLLITSHIFSQDMVLFASKEKGVPSFGTKSIIPKYFDLITYFNNSLARKIKQKEILKNQSKNSILVNFISNDNLKHDSFKITFSNNQLTFFASNKEGFLYSINHFFYHFTKATATSITIPEKITFKSTPAFEYREIYFSENFKLSNRLKFKTHSLEDKWALWGHNLKKWVKKEKVSDSIYALIDDQRTKNQLCFSSSELYKIIKKNTINYKSGSKFVIAPFDNTLVCLCTLCKATGNTKNNTAPTVFVLLKKLAKEFPKNQFWTLGYATISKPPSFKLSKNVGVFLSTINSQESLPLESTKKGKEFLKTILKWKQQVSAIYIWDYVVNFDNYLTYYPILKSTQKNLIQYKKHGVTGVFLQGSGYDFSLFDDIKYDVLSQLLWDTSLNVDDLVSKSMKERYPKLHEDFFEFITFMENTSIKHRYKQLIYGGLLKVIKKNMSVDALEHLETYLTDIKGNKYIKTRIAFLFLELELIRYKGFNNTSFGKIKKNKLKITKDIKQKVSELAMLLKKNVVSRVNERNFTLVDYIKNWEKMFLYYKDFPDFYNVVVNSLSLLDEDYTDLSILNNGTLGFKDYTTNWLIFSKKELLLSTNTLSRKPPKINGISIGFLIDKKHNIFAPSVIKIYQKNTLLSTVDFKNITLNNLDVYRKNIIFKKKISLKDINIKIYNTHKSIAIDEIKFIKI